MKSVALLLLTLLTLMSTLSASAASIASGGRSSYVILISPKAQPVERFAAEELQRYLARITGATLPVATEAGGEPYIAVGESATTSGISVPSRYEGDDAFRLRTVGENLVIVGAHPRGTLFGVYAYLERLGCWWFAPATPTLAGHSEYVPRLTSLSLEPLDVLEQPLMKYRKKDADDPRTFNRDDWPAVIDWMAKNRFNTLSIFLDPYEDNRDAIRRELEKRGLWLETGKHDALPRLLPPQKYFAQHPDWYGMVKGKRVGNLGLGGAMFETANPQAVEQFTNNLIAYLRERPEVNVYQIWPPDGAQWSESPEALAQGSSSERMAFLVQHVARAVRAAGLKTRLSYLAYESYTVPPRNMDFPKDMLVEFCPIDQNYAKSLDDASDPKNAQYASELKQWTEQFPGEVSHYSYYAKYSWESLPVHVPAQIAHDMRFWHDVGEVGASMYCEPGNWLTVETNHLAFARAAWEKDFDADRWYDAYLKARFGAAAPAMKLFQQAATRISLGALIPQSRGTIPVPSDALQKAKETMRQAAQAADTDEARWLIDRLSWQPEYLDLALQLRQADATGKTAERDDLRDRIQHLARPHCNDGTMQSILRPQTF